MIEFGGHGKEREMRRKGKKSQDSSKACYFCHKESHLKNDCKYQQELLKKKGEAVEANVTSGVNTEVLMASFVEDNTSKSKN